MPSVPQESGKMRRSVVKSLVRPELCRYQLGMKCTFVLPAVCLLLTPALADAEVWRCDGRTYRSAPVEGEKCERLDTGVICGKGNRFISPARPGQNPGSETACERTGANVSPFVNTAATPAPAVREKKRVLAQQPKTPDPMQGIDASKLGNPAEIQKLLNSVNQALAGQ